MIQDDYNFAYLEENLKEKEKDEDLEHMEPFSELIVH